MQAALAPRGDSRTYLTHFVGSSLDDDRYVVQRYLTVAKLLGHALVGNVPTLPCATAGRHGHSLTARGCPSQATRPVPGRLPAFIRHRPPPAAAP